MNPDVLQRNIFLFQPFAMRRLAPWPLDRTRDHGTKRGANFAAAALAWARSTAEAMRPDVAEHIDWAQADPPRPGSSRRYLGRILIAWIASSEPFMALRCASPGSHPPKRVRGPRVRAGGPNIPLSRSAGGAERREPMKGAARPALPQTRAQDGERARFPTSLAIALRECGTGAAPSAANRTRRGAPVNRRARVRP